ncbi:MAG: putative lipoprotein [Paenibacillaceae bacterium]|jgi:NitT/TauT family transport system substrate-binding protein|nr:putative lipoprotein [Paenibacillaceae bacterium]
MNRLCKQALSAVLGLTLILNLAGCGGSSEDSAASSSPTASVAASAAVASPSASPSAVPSTAPAVKAKLKVGALKGPTGMGMAQLMEQNANGAASADYEFTLLDSPDDMTAKIINGDLDAAAIPTNLALTLYNKTEGAIQLAAVNTLGVLYVLEKGNTITSIADLKGKTVYTSGKGATPDFAFRYILKQNGLDPEKDVVLDYKLQQAELAAAAASGDAPIALLPQPHVTTAMLKNPELRIALDVTKEWEKAAGSANQLAMGTLVVQKKTVAAQPDAIKAFLAEYKTSAEFVNKDSAKASELIAKYAILPSAAVALKAIPFSNITYIEAQDAKPMLNQFYKVLFDFEPKSVGGKLADEGFYYTK